MKVKLELEDGEEGCFQKATFRVSVEKENLFSIVVENVNQFLYPFVNGEQSLKKAFLEMLWGRDDHDLIQAMELEKWKTSDLEGFRDVVEKEIVRRSKENDLETAK